MFFFKKKNANLPQKNMLIIFKCLTETRPNKVLRYITKIDISLNIQNSFLKVSYRTGALFGHKFGLTTFGRPQLKLHYYYCYYDRGLMPVCGARCSKFQPIRLPYVRDQRHYLCKTLRL